MDYCVLFVWWCVCCVFLVLLCVFVWWWGVCVLWLWIWVWKLLCLERFCVCVIEVEDGFLRRMCVSFCLDVWCVCVLKSVVWGGVDVCWVCVWVIGVDRGGCVCVKRVNLCDLLYVRVWLYYVILWWCWCVKNVGGGIGDLWIEFDFFSLVGCWFGLLVGWLVGCWLVGWLFCVLLVCVLWWL